jgi:hypothetical protein
MPGFHARGPHEMESVLRPKIEARVRRLKVAYDKQMATAGVFQKLMILWRWRRAHARRWRQCSPSRMLW